MKRTVVGYAQKTIKVDLSKDTILNVFLTKNNVLQEVVVTASPLEIGVKGTQMSAINVPVTQIKAVPALLGETDVIKALQLLPGVQAGTEGFTGFYVRGGGPDENLFLLDGVPLYDINHLGGFFSVFNADAIKSVTLYKGGFPARFGSRLSSVVDIRIDTVVGDKNISSYEMIGYAEDNFNIGSHIKANLGLHYSAFSVQGKFYHSLQPRASIRAMLTDNLSLKAGYSQMNQYIHLLSNNSISLPTDLWVPVTKRIEPMISHQVALGAFYNLKNIVDLSVEGYYKTMDNIIEYKDGATFLNINTGWEDKVSTGRGWAYGVELLAQKTIGKTTGWIGYTWAKSDRLFDRPGQEINFGKVFPGKYDRRHDLSVVVSHKVSEKIDFAGTWVYSSGDCATLGLQNYAYDGFGLLNEGLSYIDSRNNYRKPAYHRLDLGINFHRKKKHGTATWNISVYNVYNRNNPFFIYAGEKWGGYLPNGEYGSKKVLKQISKESMMLL